MILQGIFSGGYDSMGITLFSGGYDSIFRRVCVYFQEGTVSLASLSVTLRCTVSTDRS